MLDIACKTLRSSMVWLLRLWNYQHTQWRWIPPCVLYFRGQFNTNGDNAFLPNWGQVTHVYFSKLTTIGSDNGLLSDRRHVFIWTNAAILLIRPLGTNFNEFCVEIHIFSLKIPFESVVWKMAVISARSKCIEMWCCVINWVLYRIYQTYFINPVMKSRI